MMDYSWILPKLALAILLLYGFCIFVLFLYSLAVLQLTLNFRRAVKSPEELPQEPKDWPKVTVQLPIYNEQYVLPRLIDCIANLDYPSEQLEIQILDDSTDLSQEIARGKVAEWQQKGVDITYLHRTNRKGFKAGALREGLAKAKGELIAIFDADFLPKTDWLKQTVIHFHHPRIGMVQTRWGHINRNYSLLTKILAFALDAHFTLEQVGRNSANHFINFNGTAGIWRKQCILDAGNWQSDTLTEDLDLSYRAQLKKWKFKYLPHVETPAELPAVVSAARTQQFRWNKGGAENMVKLILRIWRAPNLNLSTRIHGSLHLMNSTVFLMIFVLSMLSVPVLFIKNHYTEMAWIFDLLSFFLVTTFLFFYCYWQAHKYIYGGGWSSFKKYVVSFTKFYTLVLGFSFHNTVAVLEGLFAFKSEFVRTPKFNVLEARQNVNANAYLIRKLSFSVYMEALFFLYFLGGIALGVYLGDLALLPFHLLLSFGFGFVVYNSVLRR